jgi:hypothetical protein
MSGGAITNNRGNWGGGVFIGRQSNFIMTGGTIRGNTAEKGGGVYIDFVGTFTMNGGTISGNTAKRGGGIYFNGGVEFAISGGEVQGNTSTDGNGWGQAVLFVKTYDFSSREDFYSRDTAIGSTDRIQIAGNDFNSNGTIRGMPTTAGQTLNGWTRQ